MLLMVGSFAVVLWIGQQTNPQPVRIVVAARDLAPGERLTADALAVAPIGLVDAHAAVVSTLVPRVVELVYTAHELAPFAEDVLAEVGAEQWAAWFPGGPESLTPGPSPSGQGVPVDPGALRPFAWDPVRRAVLRAELDAYYAKLYGLTRDELRYILDPQDVYGPDFPGEAFRVLKERELREYGEYRTRRLVLGVHARVVSRLGEDLGGSSNLRGPRRGG
jgi:hypothetical protein